jgi:hypothetical protein
MCSSASYLNKIKYSGLQTNGSNTFWMNLKKTHEIRFGRIEPELTMNRMKRKEEEEKVTRKFNAALGSLNMEGFWIKSREISKLGSLREQNQWSNWKEL